VQLQQDALQGADVVDVDRQVLDRVDHPPVGVLHPQVEQEAPGALEVLAPQRELDRAVDLALAVLGRRGARAGGDLCEDLDR
jgi:hypothetical protein